MSQGGDQGEQERLAALARYAILDTPPEEPFDRLARVTATLLDTPIAFLTIVAADRVWIKAAHGSAVSDVARELSFCTHALAQAGALVVEDATRDPRFRDNPLVAGAPGLRFYAGAPLTVPGGHRLGTLCALDTRPRTPTPAQIDALVDLAALAVGALELRRESAERARAAAMARAERQRLVAVVDSLPFNLWVCDADGRYLLQNRIGREQWGDNVGMRPQDLPVPAALRDAWCASNARALAGETVRAEITQERQGQLIHIEEVLAPIRADDGTVAGFVGVNLDISDRKRAERQRLESEARLRAAIEALPFDFWVCDAAGRYVMNNETWRRNWGSHVGQRPEETTVPAEVTRLWAESNARALAGETVRYTVTYGSGETARAVDAILAPVRIGEEVIGLVGVNIDMTEHKRAERRVHHLAHHDELTGLANRRGLQQRLDEAVARSRRRSELLALILIDLDDFKAVNDRLGHDGGDEVLRELAARLRRAGRASDVIARLGGDEFAVLADGLRGPLDADRIVARLVEAVRGPVRCAGQEVHPTASAGVALFPPDAGDGAELLRHADLALYRAKELGPGRWRFYDDRLRVQAQRRRTLESELRGALDRSELTVFYQPIIGLAGEAEISFEALLRWRHPERGLLTPAEFLAVAEETGLVVPIGELVLRRAAEDARRFAEAGGRLGRMAVNVARLQLLNGDLDGLVAAALHDTGLPPENLEIEVTESVFLGRNAGDAGDALRRLRARGVGIVLDDFGTGYASLTHLRRLPLDKLKIDRSFVGDLGRRSDTALIVRTIIELGRRLGLRVVAEGVETAAQLAFLRAHGCHEAQGYLIAPPAPAVELLADPIALVRLAHLRTRQRRRAGQRPATLL